MPTIYSRSVQLLGAAFLILAVWVGFNNGLIRDQLILTGLGVAAAWLRFSLAPAGALTLAPISFFFALLLMNPWDAFVVAMAVALIAALAFGQVRGKDTLEQVGEDGTPSFLAALVAALSPATGLNDSVGPVGYLGAVVAYILSRIIVGGISAYAKEGITPRGYLFGTARSNLLNLGLLGIVAFVLRLYLFGQFGYFAVVLATIALVEFYHPWKLLSEQDEILFSSLELLAQSIDLKDPYTAKHSRNVARIAARIARQLGLAEDQVREIRIGALMHDIGKVGVSTALIRKPSKLDPEEREIMRAHPIMSADIMQPIELLAKSSVIVRHHHEHMDGSGYPERWTADRIPIGSRVILVADAFDAMTTDRPYRRGRSKREALKELQDHSDTQFDRQVVRALEEVMDVL